MSPEELQWVRNLAFDCFSPGEIFQVLLTFFDFDTQKKTAFKTFPFGMINKINFSRLKAIQLQFKGFKI